MANKESSSGNISVIFGIIAIIPIPLIYILFVPLSFIFGLYGIFSQKAIGMGITGIFISIIALFTKPSFYLIAIGLFTDIFKF